MEPIPTLPAPQNFERNPTPINEQGLNDSRKNSEAVPSPERSGEGVKSSTPPPKTEPPAAPVNNPVPQQDNKAASQSSTDDVPQIADDVDVIEKEWVEKAKKIVSSTKEDPHKQEKEVSKLQADYLKKRYGKQVKLTE